MKSILFHYPVLNVGGAEKSTLRMLRALCDRGWKVTLVLTTGGGTMESEIDPRIRVVRLRPRAFGERFVAAGKWAARLRALPDLVGYLAMRVIAAVRMLSFLLYQYDAAAVLLMGTSSGFVRRVVRTKVRVIWVRSDLSGADPTGRVVASLRASARGFDHFICVSEVARRSLLLAVPEAKGKDVVIYNILAPEIMLSSANEAPPPFKPMSGNGVNILSVCRLNDRAKGLVRMTRICHALKQKGLDFHWYIAGSGPDRHLLEGEITRRDIGDRMSLLGELENPFPAYQAADLVAMLSNYEGLSGVINEARVLGRPVIATSVSGVEEQLMTEESGLVVAQDDASIIAGMARMLTDEKLRERLAAGGFPRVLLNDDAKLDRLEELFLGSRSRL